MTTQTGLPMERRVFLGAMATGALAATSLAGLAGRRLRANTDVFEWKELAAGSVWATGGPFSGGTAMVVASGDQVLMVDAKFVGIAPLLRAEAEARAGSPVTMLLNTHHHGDHTGGNIAFTADTEVIAHAAAVTRIGKSLDTYKQQVEGATGSASRLGSDEAKVAAIEAYEPIRERAEAGDIAAWLPTRTVDRYPMHLPVGKVMAMVHHFGSGHTDNDLVVHLPDQNILHCGDLFFNGLHPFFDGKGGVSVAGWLRSVNLALELCDDKTTVIAGHGPIGGQDDLRKQMHYLEGLMEEVYKVGKTGMPKGAIMRMSWPFMNGLGLEQLKARAIAITYDEMFPLGPPEGAVPPAKPRGPAGKGILKDGG
jgi:cyclase